VQQDDDEKPAFSFGAQTSSIAETIAQLAMARAQRMGQLIE
jgi:hypothetical protein